MKRILGVIAAVLFISAVAQAEDMSFVTVLSSPLGSFSNLETANRATAGNVTFATRGSGAINFYGGKLSAAVTPLQINLTDNVSLRGNNITNMKVTNLELADKGTLKGYRLIANTVTLDAEASGVVHVEESERTLYNQNATVKVGKADSMRINGGDSIIGVAFDTAWTEPPVARLEWSNFFQKGSTSAESTTYKKQYLLTTSHSTETSGSEGGGDDPTDPTNPTTSCSSITTSNWNNCCIQTPTRYGCYRKCKGGSGIDMGLATRGLYWVPMTSQNTCSLTAGAGGASSMQCPFESPAGMDCNNKGATCCGAWNAEFPDRGRLFLCDGEESSSSSASGASIYYCAGYASCSTSCAHYTTSDPSTSGFTPEL